MSDCYSHIIPIIKTLPTFDIPTVLTFTPQLFKSHPQLGQSSSKMPSSHIPENALHFQKTDLTQLLAELSTLAIASADLPQSPMSQQDGNAPCQGQRQGPTLHLRVWSEKTNLGKHSEEDSPTPPTPAGWSATYRILIS